MSYNQSPKNPRGTIYIFFGVCVTIYAFLGGAQIYNESPELCVLFILAVLVLYWGMPFFIDAYKRRGRSKEPQANKPEPKWEHMPPPRKRDVILDPQTAKIIARHTLKLASGHGKGTKFVLKERKYSAPIFDSEPELDISEHTPEKNKETSAQGSKGQGNVIASPLKQIHLIDCPACGHKVSNYARACPNCGHPIADTPQVAAPSTPAPAPAIPAPQSATPRCPTCGSTDIKKLDSLDRTVSTAVWGIASGKIGKQFKCRNCGYMW